MHLHTRNTFLFPVILCICCLLFGGCDSHGKNHSYSLSGNSSDSQTLSISHQPSELLIPTAPGKKTIGNAYITLDISNTQQGYFFATYQGTNPKVKLQLTSPDEITYTYNLTDSPCCLPLTCGDGKYRISLYENIEGNQYATVFQDTFSVNISDTFGAFLYPNMYVNFTENSEAVKVANDISAKSTSQLETISNIYYYVAENIAYDYDKADNVEYNYIPDVDEVLSTKQGICFDYASLMAAMLRSRLIPTRLEIGYAGDEYHAWISTYTEDTGWIDGIIRFDGHEWSLMDPTFASTGNFSKDTNTFISNKDNYTTIYTY